MTKAQSISGKLHSAPLYCVTAEMAAMLGYASTDELTEAIGGMVWNTIHPEERERVIQALTCFRAHRQAAGDQKADGSHVTENRNPRELNLFSSLFCTSAAHFSTKIRKGLTNFGRKAILNIEMQYGISAIKGGI